MTASSHWRSARRVRTFALPPSFWAGRSTSRARKRSARKWNRRCQQLVTSASTPLESVPDLGEGVIEKLNEAGVTSVEALADMTPEQLEAIPGIGPKTVEKISIAVNNYFSSLEAGEGGGPDFQGSEDQPAGEPGGEVLNAAPEEAGVNPVEGEAVGDLQADGAGVEAVPHAEAEDLPEGEQATEEIAQQRGRCCECEESERRTASIPVRTTNPGKSSDQRTSALR